VPVRGELLLDLPVRGESLLDLELGYSMSSGSAVTGPLRVGPLRFGPGVGANRLLGLRGARGSAGWGCLWLLALPLSRRGIEFHDSLPWNAAGSTAWPRRRCLASSNVR